VDHAAGTRSLIELGKVLDRGPVRQLGLFLGVEVVEVAVELVEAVRGGQELVAVAQVVLADWPVAYPSGLSSSISDPRPLARCRPRARTLLSPVRNTLWPVMNEARPAVQLCSPYESAKRTPSSAIRSMLGVR
jgi:hypothetical protein